MSIITSMLRVRNEETIIEDTLAHLSEFSEEIFVFDDRSTDKTLEICRDHPWVRGVISLKRRDDSQHFGQTADRLVLNEFSRCHGKGYWQVYLDADERINNVQLFINMLDSLARRGFKAFYARLIDSYLTEEFQEPYKKGSKMVQLERKWGPEFRKILLGWKRGFLKYNLKIAVQRHPQLKRKRFSKELSEIILLHYGKSLSVEEWERKVEHYNGRADGPFKQIWKDRKGKAIHEESDFKRTLYPYPDVLKELINLRRVVGYEGRLK